MTFIEEPRDLGNERQNQTLAKTQKVARANQDGEFAAMMTIPGFRAFIWRLLEGAHLFELSMKLDPYQTYFREGERNIGLMLMADVHRLCPEQYPVMAAEAAKRKEAING